MRSLVISLVIGASAVSATNALAQSCEGSASFAAGPARVGAGFAVTDGLKTYGVNGAIGQQMGWYGSASVARVSYDNADASAVGMGVNAGYAMNVTTDKKVQFCPQAGFMYQSGPDVGGISASAHAFDVGGSFGTVMKASPTLDFVPFAGAQYINATSKIDGGPSFSDDYANINVGAGFVLNRLWTIQPMVTFPVGLEGAKSTFQIGVGYSFGGSTAAAPARR